jgi:hypothetical protein
MRPWQSSPLTLDSLLRPTDTCEIIHGKLVSGRACNSLEQLVILIGGIQGREHCWLIPLADTVFPGIPRWSDSSKCFAAHLADP